jgi:hypothetical protein
LRGSHRLGQPAAGVHAGHDVGHALQGRLGLVDDQIGAFDHLLQLAVGDDDGDL